MVSVRYFLEKGNIDSFLGPYTSHFRRDNFNLKFIETLFQKCNSYLTGNTVHIHYKINFVNLL
jgi:hypothetical protein